MRFVDFVIPRSVDEALDHLDADGHTVISAGGTCVARNLEESSAGRRTILYVGGLAELSGIEISDDGRSRIGSVTTCAQLADHPQVRQRALILAQAALSVGSPQIRNQATVGGNLASRGAAADLVPVLIALNATVGLRSRRESRRLPLADYLSGPPRGDEILTDVDLDPAPRTSSFLRVAARRSLSPAIASVAVVLGAEPVKGEWGFARIALGGVRRQGKRASGAEGAMVGAPLVGERCAKAIARAAEAGRTEIDPCDDMFATGQYRRHVSGVLIERALEQASARLASPN